MQNKLRYWLNRAKMFLLQCLQVILCRMRFLSSLGGGRRPTRQSQPLQYEKRLFS